ncbi:MAG TPA: MFS transporter [Anaerolineaceae bacterium]|nr:MFS transporter [Anaerolineaceae bacterium]
MSRNIHPDRVLTPLGIGLALSLLGDATLYAVLPSPDIATQAGLSLAMVGFLLGINRLVRLIFNGFAGWVYDRLPRRPLMIISLLIGTLSTAFYAFGSGPVILITGRVLWGLAWSGLWIGANSMTLDLSDDLNRGKLNGRLQMWFFIAVAVSSFSGGLFTDLFTYRGGLWVSTILSGIGFLIWLKYLPETRPIQRENTSSLKEERPPSSGFPWKLTLTCSFPFFVNRVIFTGVLGSTTILWLRQFVENGSLTFNQIALPLATMSGTFIAVRILVSIISVPQIGRLSDYIKRRWLVMAIIFLIFGAGGLFLMASENIWISIIGVLLSAVAGGSIPALIPAIIGDHVQQNQQSRSLGWIFSFGDLGSAIGPPIALALVEIIDLPTIFIGCAILLSMTGLYTVFFAVIENKQILLLNEKNLVDHSQPGQ